MVKAVYKAELLKKTSSKNMTCTRESITCSLLSKSSDARKWFLLFIFIQVSQKNHAGQPASSCPNCLFPEMEVRVTLVGEH